MNTAQVAVSHLIWESRYRRPDKDGRPERSIADSWRRVALAAAAAETEDRQEWQQRFLEILQDFRFLPGGRILAGAGTGLDVTLCNCFVMGLIEDDMDSIFNALREGALTMQAGGGVGYDFSTLRPKGSIAARSGNIASGPVSYMHIWNSMCDTLLSTGARRGAMIATLRCDHPDIEIFIDAKRDNRSLNHFNLSVQITDEFMDAVRQDRPWALVFPLSPEANTGTGETILRRWPGHTEPVPCRVLGQRSARELWQRIMLSAYETAEPGVLFVDRINHWNNLGYRELLSTTNPCGEIPLPPYGACDLGAINLTRFVTAPFTPHASLDFAGIAQTAAIAARFLDNIISISHFPLARQAEEATGSRRIGLGITGLADMLIMLGHSYDSASARLLSGEVMATICHSAYRSSIQQAREKGSFPFFVSEAYLERPFIRSLPTDICDGIAAHGIRNSHLTAIAPCGTVSLLAGNVSSGIEPVFDLRLRRRVLQPDGSYQELILEDYAYQLWREVVAADATPGEVFVTSQTVAPAAQLQMQAVLQAHVDNAIAKTVNVPAAYPYADFASLYLTAHEQGLKGCTAFRPNPVTGAILSHVETGESPVHCCHIERQGE